MALIQEQEVEIAPAPKRAPDILPTLPNLAMFSGGSEVGASP